MGFYLSVHWLGGHSLARSFWINGLALWVSIRLVFYFISPQIFGEQADIYGFLFYFFLLQAIAFAVWVWQLVGIWRSAKKRLLQSDRRLFARLAQFSVIMGWSAMAFAIRGQIDYIAQLFAQS